MSKKLPFYKMYPADAETDENFRLMNCEQRGMYWTLLNYSWMNEGLPEELEDLRELVRMSPEEFSRSWPKVSRCFIKRRGRLVNQRQENERDNVRTQSERNAQSARARYGSQDVRSANAPIRASESVSGSDSVFEDTSSEEKTSTRASETSVAVICPPDLEPPAILAEVRAVYRQGGAPIPDAHENMAVQLLIGIPVEKRARIANYVKWAFFSGKWPSPAKTKGFLNLIRDGDWDVELTQRVLPQPETEKGQRSKASYDNVVQMLEG